ncbi:MAG: hypothetical protein HDT26_12790 [Subdoligranulum sp.]|nr:hypothetical protein [Subdoligranulum sp.]
MMVKDNIIMFKSQPIYLVLFQEKARRVPPARPAAVSLYFCFFLPLYVHFVMRPAQIRLPMQNDTATNAPAAVVMFFQKKKLYGRWSSDTWIHFALFHQIFNAGNRPGFFFSMRFCGCPAPAE